MNKWIFIVNIFSFISLQAAEEMHLVSLEGESQRWAEINTPIHDQLKLLGRFSVQIDNTVSRPTVDLQARKIFVSSVLNDEIDQNGISAMRKYEIFQAFGREAVKDEPFSYFSTRPRLYTNMQKHIALGLFSPFACITLVGLGFLFDGALKTDPEQRSKSFSTGLALLAAGGPGSLLMGHILIETHGGEFHLTKKGKQQSDAEYFAIEHLPKVDLQAISTELYKKRCLPVQNWNMHRLIEAQLHKLKSEAAASDPA